MELFCVKKITLQLCWVLGLPNYATISLAGVCFAYESHQCPTDLEDIIKYVFVVVDVCFWYFFSIIINAYE